MSLVNDMLNDLDARRQGQLSDEVNLDWMRGQHNNRRMRRFLPLLWLLLIAILLVIAYQLWQLNRSDVLPGTDYRLEPPATVSADNPRQQGDKDVPTASVATTTPAKVDAASIAAAVSAQPPRAKVTVAPDTAVGVEPAPVATAIAPQALRIEQQPPVPARPAPVVAMKSPRPLSSDQRDRALQKQVAKLLQQQQFAAAEQQLVAFMQDNPLALRSGNQLVSLWLSQQRVEPAQQLLERLADAYPQHAEVIKSQARLYLQTGQVAQAVALLMSVQPPLPGHTDYYELLGLAARKNSQHALSEQVYRGLLDYDAGRGDWWMGLAIAIDLQARPGAAREAYRQALSRRGLSGPLRNYAQQRLAAL